MKQRYVNGIARIALSLALALAGCPTGGGGDGGSTPQTPAAGKCTCPAGTEYKYNAAKCYAGTDCACRVYYGEVNGLTYNGRNVRVYKEAGAVITDAQMVEAVTKLQTGYNSNGASHTQMNDKITAIHIIDDRAYYYDTGKVLGVHYNKPDAAFGSYLVGISDNSITQGTSVPLN